MKAVPVRTLQVLVGTLLLLSVCPSSDAHPPPSARNLFLAGRDQWIMFLNNSLSSADDTHLGLRCSIVDRTRTAIAAEDPPDIDIADDRVQLRLEANADSYIYVLHKGRDHWVLLLPPADRASGGQHITAPRSPRTVTAPSGWLKFADEPESKQFFVILARSPIRSLEKVNTSLSNARPASRSGVNRDGQEPLVDDGLVNALRNSVRMWDVVFERTHDAVYVVSKNMGGESRLGIDVGLRRRHH
jgi:hypothetical protein